MTTEDYAALDALAAAATPGPWRHVSKNVIDTPPIDVDEADWGPEGHHGYVLRSWSDGTGWRNADAAYIAAASPDVVRRIIADLDAETARADAAEALAARNWKSWEREATEHARTLTGRARTPCSGCGHAGHVEQCRHLDCDCQQVEIDGGA